MAQPTVRPARMTIAELLKLYVKRVKTLPHVRSVWHDVPGGRVVTVIDSEPGEFEPCGQVYDAEGEVLAVWPDDEFVLGFRLINPRELDDGEEAVSWETQGSTRLYER